MSLFLKSHVKTQREEDGLKTHREEGQVKTEAEIKVIQIQGMPKIAGGHQNPGKSKEAFSEPFERA